MALEVNFYAGTRELYDNEIEIDKGGLYALIDGLGLYRGEQPVAGPCPIDISCIEETRESHQNHLVINGTFSSSEQFIDLVEFFNNYKGYGGRPVRVSGSDDSILLMYNCGEVSETSLEFVQAQIASEFATEVETVESVSATLYKLTLNSDTTFVLHIVNDSIPMTDISVRTLQDRISSAEGYIAKVEKSLNDNVSRIDSRIDAHQSQMNSEISRIDSEISKNVDELNATIEQLNSTVSSKISKLEESTSTRFTQVESSIESANLGISKNAEDIEDLTSNVNEVTAGLASTDSKVAELQTKSNNLSSGLANTDSELAKLKETVNGNSTAIQSLEALKGTVEGHTSQITDLSSEVAELSSDVKSNTSTISETSEELSKLKTVVDALDEASGGQGTEVAELKEQVADLTTRVEELEQNPATISWITLP